MTDRSLVPQLPTNSEELREPLSFSHGEYKMEIKNVKSLVFMVIKIGGLTIVLRCIVLLC